MDGENSSPLRNTSLYIGLIVIAIIVLALYGAYRIYKTRIATQPLPSPTPTLEASPSGFQSLVSPTPGPSPVLGAKPPTTQPASGFDLVEIKNVGIYVDSPRTGQTITSPVKVSGKANVLNGDVQIRIKDETGNIIGNGKATACLGTDACPFETQVSFSTPQAKSGSIELYTPNVLDGSEDYLQTVYVNF